jgi:hypothetical protein
MTVKRELTGEKPTGGTLQSGLRRITFGYRVTLTIAPPPPAGDLLDRRRYLATSASSSRC